MVQRKHGCAALALLALLGACSVGPDYERPAVTNPDAWSADIAAHETESAPWPSQEWWRAFHQPDLDRYMELARTANPDVAAAVARVRQANAQAQIAGASLLPALSAGLAQEGSRARPGTDPGAIQTAASLSATYELDFWGRYADRSAAALAAAQSSRFARETTALTVAADIAGTYFSLIALQDRIAVARDNIANAEGTLAAIRARAEAGTLSALDLAQQQSLVAVQRAALPPLVQLLRQATGALAILSGQLPESVTAAQGSLNRLTVPVVAPGLPSELLARRPDVADAEAQLIGANADIRAAIAAWYPDIALTADGGGVSPAISKVLRSSSANFYTLAASVTQPLFSGGAIEGGIELSKGRYDELSANYRKAVLSAFADVETALTGVKNAADLETEQQAAADTAQRAYDIAQSQFANGTIDVLVLLTTQQALFQAKDALIQARLTHAQAAVGLFRALGGGWRI